MPEFGYGGLCFDVSSLGSQLSEVLEQEKTQWKK
jgi:hypothetical protein